MRSCIPRRALSSWRGAPARRHPRPSSRPMNRRRETQGLLFGFVGMLGFSLTVPMLRMAVHDFDPVVVGLGRILISLSMAVPLLAWRRGPFPQRRHWPGILVIALGPMIAYPLIVATALRQVPAAHGAVVVGLLPLATAIGAVLRGRERPSGAFWLAALAGSAAVVGFALVEGHWRLHAVDGWLLLAVALCGWGYAEGGHLSRELGVVSVLCWGLVVAGVLVAIPVARAVAVHGLHGSTRAWVAFAYTGVVSMFLAFLAWYHGLALGGVARVGQLQLLQPFVSLGWAAWLLGEHLSGLMLVTVLIVGATVALGRRATVRHSLDEEAVDSAGS